MTIRRFVTPGLIVVALAGIMIWRVSVGNAPVPVEAVEVKRGPLEVEWSAVGYVEARTAAVSSPAIGVVHRVMVQEGDRVAAGQTLAILRSASECAAVEAARAGLRMAEAQRTAADQLLAEARAAQQAREDRARAELSASRAREAQARASLAHARETRKAAVEAARAELASAAAGLRDLETPARPEEIARADAELAAAKAALQRAEAELRRYEELEASGAASRRDVDAARETHARCAATKASAEQTAALLRRGARSDQIEAARAKVSAARAQLQAAEAQLNALDVLEQQVAEAVGARKVAEAAMTEALTARLRVAATAHEALAARSRTEQSQSVTQQALAQLGDRRIAAPFSGIVGRRYADPGDMAGPSTALFSIVEDNRTWVVAEVDEQDLAPVRAGDAVDVSVPAYAGRRFRCRIERIGGEAVPQTEVRTGARIVRVRVSLDDLSADDRSMLKPGMEVHVRGKTVLVADALLVPSDAVTASDGGSFVWAIHGGRAHRTEVVCGYAGVQWTEVRSALRQGDRIVVSGKENLSEKTRVQSDLRITE